MPKLCGCKDTKGAPVLGDALTIREVAALLHLSEATAYRLARAGELPGAVRIGKSWRVDPRRLDGIFAR